MGHRPGINYTKTNKPIFIQTGIEPHLALDSLYNILQRWILWIVCQAGNMKLTQPMSIRSVLSATNQGFHQVYSFVVHD